MSGWKETGLNFGIVIGLSQALRFFNAENPTTILLIRTLYILSNIAFYGILAYCYTRIEARKDSKELTYTEVPPSYSEAQPVTIITTYQEYDRSELIKFIRSSLISLAISVFIHFKFGYLQPIFIQSFLPLKNIVKNPIVRIHLLNHQPEEELKRPFKVNNNPFSGTSTVESKKKSIKAKVKKSK